MAKLKSFNKSPGFSIIAEVFQAVKIVLGSRDIRKTIHSILQSCNLPTSYLDSIPQPSIPFQTQQQGFPSDYPAKENEYEWTSYDVEDAEEDIAETVASQDSLRFGCDK